MDIIMAVICTLVAGYLGSGILGNLLNWPDAGAICAKFGGGGHRGAAGANLNLSLEEATNAVIAAMPTLE